MRLVLLGPIGLYREGRLLPMARPQQATVLTALAVDVGRVVGVGTLIDRVWGVDPPSAARRSLQAHLARLNQLLPDGALVRNTAGYRLAIEPETVDLHRFGALVRAARSTSDDLEHRARWYAEALALWAGDPLGGMAGPWAEQMREAWRQQHLDALAGWAGVLHELGRQQETVGPLTAAVRDDPGAETVVAALMRALHAGGQTGEALTRYAALREHLAETLGVEPGAPVQRLHVAILRDEAPPSGLPAAVRAFAGRAAELRRLDAMLPAGPETATRTIVVSGMAGVGKTTLAVHWARQVAGRYPGGQLYLNLRGFDPRGTGMTPSEALFALLEALGVEARRIPFSLDGQISLYRSVLTGRRVLMLLDNVRDAEHLRPLLPGTPGCLVVVTSRNRLTSLVATEGAGSLTVGPLAQDEARAMLGDRLDAARVEAAPAAVERLVASCAGLPLAVALVAARAATQPELDLAELAGQLPGDQPLDTFDVGDPALSMRAVFSWSYEALTPAAARLFRLLGVHPGHAITRDAAASLAGLPRPEARGLLAELLHAHLLTELSPGRFTMHDLLRLYTVDLAGSVEPAPSRDAATTRVLDHYLHSAYAADRLLRPDHTPLSLPAPDPGALVTGFADQRAAYTWLAAEYPVILAAAEYAAEHNQKHSWRLVWCLENFMEWTGRWREFEAVQHAALDAARRAGDTAGQAHTHRGIARTCCRTDRFEEALDHLFRALDLFTMAGSASGVTDTHRSVAVVLSSLDRHEEAAEHVHTSLRLAEAAGDDAARALAHNNLAFQLALLGRAGEGVAHCDEALAVLRRLGARAGEARVLSTLGRLHTGLGRHEEAIAAYRQSIELLAALGDRTGHAEMLTRFGDALHAAGDVTLARDTWLAALRIFDSLGQFDLLGRYDQIARVRERAQQALRPPPDQ